MRHSLSVLVVLSLVGMASTSPVHAWPPDALREVLNEGYRPSSIQVQNPRTQGDVIKPGVVLVLQADGVSANKLRFAQINTKSPRFHVRDYARVEIAPDGRLTVGSGEVTLAKLTRLVVLDLKVDSDRVRLFTHTLTPVRVGDGQLAYGCTEFFFRFDAGALERADAALIEGRIGELLVLASTK